MWLTAALKTAFMVQGMQGVHAWPRLQMATACLQQWCNLICPRQLAEARHALLHQAQHIVLVRRLEQLDHLRSKIAALASVAVSLANTQQSHTGRCPHEVSMPPALHQLLESWLTRQVETSL